MKLIHFAALIAALFIAAAFVGQRQFAWLPAVLKEQAAYHAVIWMGAIVLALPLFIATFRKLQALGLLIAELSVRPSLAGPNADAIQTVISHAIPIAGLIGLIVFGLALSSTLLPPFEILAVLLVVVALLTVLLWKSSIRLYSQAQVALQETLDAQPILRAPTPATLPILSEANLRRVPILATSPAAGRLIREIALRGRTGTSIVGIDRGNQSVINPGPDEEIIEGDLVLILGTPAQLDAAAAALGLSPESAS
jgi:CPA2 family monovalent cation:H+ antiporter-2